MITMRNIAVLREGLVYDYNEGYSSSRGGLGIYV